MSGRAARAARQRKQEARERLRVEAQKALAAIMEAFIRHTIDSERRLMAILSEFQGAASIPATHGARYIERVVYWDVFGPPSAPPADPSAHTWTRLPARWTPEIITAQELHEARDAAERATNAAFHQRRNLFR